LTTARDLIARARVEIGAESLRAELVELIATVIIYKLPRLTREEIQAMLQVHDIRESKVYQEAKQEGREEGKQEGREEGKQEGREEGIAQERRRAIGRLAAKKVSAQEIADLLGLAIEEVRSEMPKGEGE
jgi:predicted transposase/invertase (TIGR01784 family)